MPSKRARGKSPGRKTDSVLSGTHIDDGKPMVPASSELIDDEWVVVMALAASLMIIAPRCVTWDICVWIGFALTVIIQVLFVCVLKKDGEPFLKMYIFISCTLLVLVFGDCVVGRPWIDVVNYIHPLQYIEMSWCSSAKDQFNCILRSHTSTSYAVLFCIWMRIWLWIPVVSGYVQRLV